MSMVFSECVSECEGVYLHLCGRTEHSLQPLHEVFYLDWEGCVLEGESQKMVIDFPAISRVIIGNKQTCLPKQDCKFGIYIWEN